MKSEEMFNTDPLLNELNDVIQNGMSKLFNNYIANYKLYEETHKCIMNLQCVKNAIDNKKSSNENYDDLPDLISISSSENSDENSDEFINYSNHHEEEIEEEIKDTILNMKKNLNELLKEKEVKEIFINQQQEFYNKTIKNSERMYNDLKEHMNRLLSEYENNIEERNKEIQVLKNKLNSYELLVNNDDSKKKLEKENIILHIEENSDEAELNDNEESEEESNKEEEEPVLEEEEPVLEEEEPLLEEEQPVVEEEEPVLEEEQPVVEEEEPLLEEEQPVVEEEQPVLEEEQPVLEEEQPVLEESDVETEKSLSDEEEDEEEELFEVEIDGIIYCTENEDSGFIYILDKDGNVGEPTGYFKNGEPFFN